MQRPSTTSILNNAAIWWSLNRLLHMRCLTWVTRTGTGTGNWHSNWNWNNGGDAVGVTAELEHTAFGGTYVGGAEAGLHELTDRTRVGYRVHAVHTDHLRALFSLFCRGDHRLCLRFNRHPVVIWTCFHAYLFKQFTISVFATDLKQTYEKVRKRKLRERKGWRWRSMPWYCCNVN